VKAEETQQRQAEASALLQAARSVLEYREFEDAARSIFDACKKLIGATAGYVALLSRDGTENEVLFLDSGGLPCDVDPSLPMPIRGLRAEAYRSGKTAYDNDFPNSEWVRFLPEGHAELHNVLFAPLTIEGNVVGLLGLANKPGGFTDHDARMATAFGELAAVALHNSQTLQALENSEQRFRSLVESAADAIISADSGGNMILWNRRVESMFGYRTEEVVGKPLTIIMPERFREAHKKGMKRVSSTGKSRIIGETIELAGLRRDGSEFPLELSVAKWETGEELFFTAVIRDITERKQAEEALRERTHHLSERVKELTCLYSISHLIEQPGTSLEDLLQGTVELIRPAWQYPEVACARIVLKDQEFRTENFRESKWRQTADIIVLGERLGTVEVCYLGERPERDEGPFLKEERSLIDAIAQTLGRAIANRRAQERIQEQGAFLQTVLDALGHPFYVVDANDYSIKMANAAARLSPLTPTTTCYALTHGLSEPCKGDQHVCPLHVVKETKEPVTVEHIHRDADGNDRPVEVHCHPVFDDQGNVKQVIEYTLDITERRQAEEQLEKLRSEFLGMVTHELKTPLTAIKGSAATALGSRRPFDPQENRELFQIIDEQADRLRDLVDNLLDMSRIEAGSLSVSPEPTDLRAVLEEARATFMRSGGSHQVELELPDGLPAVAADRHRVVQVLTNLLNNAARFSPPTVPIAIVVEYDPLHVTVHVRDCGQGIPREKLPRLFKKFSQVHDDTGQKLSGTGLGLAICKGIVDAHGGRIWADSAGEGQGSTFSFTLPVATETSVKSLSDEARRTLHLGRVRRPGERTRVLAVDDEPQVLSYLQRSLDEAGYQAIVTADPSQVAKLVELEEPDLILLDLRLPGTSGFDLLKRIREFSGVPVVFLTASGREEDTVHALKMGADDYITKPFSPSELLARIEAALRRRLLPDVMEVRPPFVLGDLTISFAERRVIVAGKGVSLSATEYKILYELATHAGRVLTHGQILQAVWGPEYSGETELVRSFIRNLRRKLGDDARHPRFILTERQVGYRMPRP